MKKKITTPSLSEQAQLWNGWADAYKQIQETKGDVKQVAICVEGCDDCTIFEWYVFESELEDLVNLAIRCNETSRYGCQPKIHIFEDLESAEHYDKNRMII